MRGEAEEGDFRAGDALAVLLLAFLLLIAFVYVLPKKALIFANAAMPLAVLIGAFYRRRALIPVLSPGRLRPVQAVWIVLGTAGFFFLLMSLVDPLLDLFPRDYRPELEELEEEILDIPPALAWFLLVVYAPFCEETFFRGALLRGFRNSWGTATALAVTSALFAVSHGIPPRMAATLVLGLWFGGVAVSSGGLAAPFLAHAINNGLVLLLFSMGRERVPMWMAAPAGAAVLAAGWGLFCRPPRTVQGSGPPAAS